MTDLHGKGMAGNTGWGAAKANGTLVEVLKDVAFRLAPMWQISAERMVRQIRSFQVLDGFRGTRRFAPVGAGPCHQRRPHQQVVVDAGRAGRRPRRGRSCPTGCAAGPPEGRASRDALPGTATPAAIAVHPRRHSERTGSLLRMPRGGDRCTGRNRRRCRQARQIQGLTTTHEGSVAGSAAPVRATVVRATPTVAGRRPRLRACPATRSSRRSRCG